MTLEELRVMISLIATGPYNRGEITNTGQHPVLKSKVPLEAMKRAESTFGVG